MGWASPISLSPMLANKIGIERVSVWILWLTTGLYSSLIVSWRVGYKVNKNLYKTYKYIMLTLY